MNVDLPSLVPPQIMTISVFLCMLMIDETCAPAATVEWPDWTRRTTKVFFGFQHLELPSQ